MTYELPTDQEYEDKAFAETWARDRVTLASQFNASVISQYEAMYRNFWSIGRPEATTDRINRALRRIDGIGLKIILDAGMYVAALHQIFGDVFPARLLIPPRPYTLREITFAEGHTVESLSTFVELIGLAQQHGMWTAGYVEVGELLEAWEGE